MNDKWKKIAIVSIILNICVLSVCMPYCMKKINQYSNLGGGEYYDNPQYEAYVSMFELNKQKTDIVFLGDSITARGRFEEFFSDKNVLNRGIGSDVSEGVLNRLDEIKTHNPSAVFLMIGINDLGHSLSVESIISNTRQILFKLQTDMPECDIYLQSVLPTTTINLTSVCELNKGYELLTREYKNCTYVDIYTNFVTETGEVRQELISEDGVHLNGKGYEMWISKINNLVDLY